MKRVFDFNLPRTFIGQWWLPGQEDTKIIGVLNYDPIEGLRLNLEDFFRGNEFDVIVGIASGEQITLLSCFVLTLVTPFHEMATYAPTKIFANKAIIGMHIDSEQNIDFEKVIVETSDIKSWSCLSGIDNGEFLKCFEKGGTSFNLPYSFPNSEVFYSDSEIDIHLCATLDIPHLMPPPTEIVFVEKNYFKIENKVADKGFFFFEYVDALRKFISLAMRSNVGVNNIQAIQKGKSELVHVLYMPMDIDLDYVTEKQSYHDMFFTYHAVKDNISEHFKSWLKGYEEMLPVYNLYFCKNRGMLHNIFLPKAQALEEYHRRTRTDANEWGYKSRIANLFEKFSDIMKLTGDKDAFSQLVLDHRDYYSHWMKKKEDKVFKGVHVDYLSRDVNLLLEMCLLTQMGFDVATVTGFVKNCHPYRGYLDIDRPLGANVFPPPRIKWSAGAV